MDGVKSTERGKVISLERWLNKASDARGGSAAITALSLYLHLQFFPLSPVELICEKFSDRHHVQT